MARTGLFPIMFVLVLALVSCSGRESRYEILPDSLTLYSIDGTIEDETLRAAAAERFHGHPVLGKIEVQDPRERREILAAVHRGRDESDGNMAKCFWPRHGIRWTKDGKTIEYVICYYCSSLIKYEGDQSAWQGTTKTPEKELTDRLTARGIPMAPDPGSR